mmetsp:Transcript_31475/g.64847  ORF Transcript_31475/g.64847 Transcript_31475/m.64847 type:complete len:408 (-) Transcript_31475:112-1335(-)
MARELLSKMSQFENHPASWNTLAAVMEESFGVQGTTQILNENDHEILQERHHDHARQKALRWLSHEDQTSLIYSADDSNGNSRNSQSENDNNINNSTKILTEVQHEHHLLQRYALATIYFATRGTSESSSSWTSCAASPSNTPCESDTSRYLSPSTHLQWEGINGNKDKVVTWLDLSSRNLTSNYFLPMEVTLLAPWLQLLWLSENPYLEAGNNLPEWMGDFGNLISLSMYRTGLAGPLPDSLYELSKLTSLRLYKNRFSGRLLEEIGDKLSNLKWLWIHENEFTGVVPSSIGNLVQLEGLTLHGNRFNVLSVDNAVNEEESDEGEGAQENLKGNVLPREVCALRKKKLVHLWGDCEDGSLEWIENGDSGGSESKSEMKGYYKVLEGVRACSCCTKCFPRKVETKSH